MQSLARTAFRPTPLRTSPASCPVNKFFGAPSSPRRTASTRTTNAVAHSLVALALAASALSFATHPDSLLFDHPPRSAISWSPTKHIASREAHSAAPTSSPFPTPSSSSFSRPSAAAASPSSSTVVTAARAVSGQATANSVVAVAASSVQPSLLKGFDLQSELRLAGVLGRSIGH